MRGEVVWEDQRELGPGFMVEIGENNPIYPNPVSMPLS